MIDLFEFNNNNGSEFLMFVVDPKTNFRCQTELGMVSLKSVNNLTECVKRDIRDNVEVRDIDEWIDAVVTVLLSAERMDALTEDKVNNILSTVIIPARDLVRQYRVDIGYWN
jgi:hypothetical protein